MDFRKYEIRSSYLDEESYYKEKKEKIDLFVKDCRKECGLEHLPDFMWERVYKYAWENSPSSELPFIFSSCLQLAPLFEGIIVSEK